MIKPLNEIIGDLPKETQKEIRKTVCLLIGCGVLIGMGLMGVSSSYISHLGGI